MKQHPFVAHVRQFFNSEVAGIVCPCLSGQHFIWLHWAVPCISKKLCAPDGKLLPTFPIFKAKCTRHLEAAWHVGTILKFERLSKCQRCCKSPSKTEINKHQKAGKSEISKHQKARSSKSSKRCFSSLLDGVCTKAGTMKARDTNACVTLCTSHFSFRTVVTSPRIVNFRCMQC